MISTILLASALQASVSSAAVPPRPSVAAPAPAPKVSMLLSGIADYFQGSWSGAGAFVKSGKPVQSGFTFERLHDGEAILVRHAEKAPNSFAYTGVVSIDGATGKPVLLMASNNKGAARLFRSEGWQGDKIVFEADPVLQAWFARERITFVRKGPTSFNASYELSRDNGATWRTGDEQLFTKN